MSSFQNLKDSVSRVREISSDFDGWDMTNFPEGKLGNGNVFDTGTACGLFEYCVGIVESALEDEETCVNNVSPGEMSQVGDTLARAAQSLQDSDHSEFVNRMEELIAIVRPFEMLPMVQAKEASDFLNNQARKMQHKITRFSSLLEGIEKKIAAHGAAADEYKQKLTELSAEAAVVEEVRKEENEKYLAEFLAERASSMEKAQKLIDSATQALQLSTAEGLAAAFKAKEEKNGSRWAKGFWLGLGILAAVAAIAIGLEWTLFGLFGNDDSDGTRTADTYTVLRRALAVFVAISITGFAGGQYAKNKTIEEDYAYKAALAASFPGLSNEFSDSEGDQEMRKEYIGRLLAEMLQDPQRVRKAEKTNLFLRKK